MNKHLSRRGLILGAGLAAGLPIGWLAGRLTATRTESRFAGHSRERAGAAGMPGAFPGRVVEVRDRASVLGLGEIQGEPVRRMIERGMTSLVGSNDVDEAWRRFFTRDDVVGIKVNPVGRRAKPGETGRVRGAAESISSPAVLVEIVRNLEEHVGVPRRNIIVFERYADEFRDAGYERLMRSRPLEGCRWMASAQRYDDDQLAIDGQTLGGRDPNVVGYDPNQFVEMGYCAPSHHPRDDRRTRSHLSMIVSRFVNKIITIPCLKDHRSAGVTMTLKNMSHGMNNNVARSHLAGIYRLGGASSGPNQCNTFIPAAVRQTPLMEKATLHILDGLVGVYEGGPGNWNRTWGTWARKSLFFATDPVALDHVGWDIIDAKRSELGWAPVAHMGGVQGQPPLGHGVGHAVLSLANPWTAATIGCERFHAARQVAREPFDRRQPEHVALAGLLGMGIFDPARIDHRVHYTG